MQENARYIDDAKFIGYYLPKPNIKLEAQTVSVPVDSDNLEGLQRFRVITAMPPGSEFDNRVAIYPQPWSEYPERPFNEKRLAVISRALGMRAVAFSNPGVGPEVDNLTEKQIEGLHRGSFAELGRTAWQACQLAGVIKPGDEITFSGYSLGTLVTGGMIETKPSDVRLAEVRIGDSPGLKKKSLPKFLYHFLTNAGVDLDKYMAMNPDWAKISEPDIPHYRRIMSQFKGHWYPVVGINRTDLAETVIRAANVEQNDEIRSGDTAWRLWHGSSSLVSSTVANHLAVEKLKEAGIKADVQTLLGEYHGMAESLPLLDDVLRKPIL